MKNISDQFENLNEHLWGNHSEEVQNSSGKQGMPNYQKNKLQEDLKNRKHQPLEVSVPKIFL